MIEFLPAAGVIASLLITYLIHSTVVLLLIGIVLRCWPAARPDTRVLLWKAALVAPIVTSLAVSLAGAPHFGPKFRIAASSQSDLSGELNRRPMETPREIAPPLVNHSEVRYFDAPSDEASDVSEYAASAVSPGELGIGPPGETQPVSASRFPVWSIFVLVCFVGSLVACVRLCVQAARLGAMRRRSTRVTEAAICTMVNDLSQRVGLRIAVRVLRSSEIQGPLTAGIFRPFILVPGRFMETLSNEERGAMFAHELVHVARRDTLWKLIGQVVCRVFYFQPLNRFARRQLELETEFVADRQAAELLDQRSLLAGCLTRLGEWLAAGPPPATRPHPLAAGMASFRSTLGRRVETLLKDNTDSKPTSRFVRLTIVVLMVGALIATIALAPRAVANSAATTNLDKKEEPMKRQITTLAVLAGLTLPSAADDKQPKKEQPARPAVTKKTPDELPNGIARFNGMLVGRLVKKDVEKGTFILNVDAVPRVWRNSKAENPKSVVGKNVLVDGVFGKWLDVLLLVKEGETLEFEGRHDGGDRLTFPGELLRKVAPYDPKDYPVLPESFRGFNGAVAAKIVKKDPETFELIVQVDRVMDLWKNNRAKNPRSIEGKQMMVAGFWRRKDQYHGLKVGDRIEVGLQHIVLRSDHLTVAEFVRKAGADSPRRDSQSAKNGFQGFVGSVVGRLVEKDVEKGTLVLTVDAVPRVWRNNKAPQPKSLIGKTVSIDGVSSRLLDVLLTTKKGETLEIAVRNDRGDRLTFLGELFRKVAPYKAEDYPVLPDEFRGFQGVVTGKIVKKDTALFGLIIQVDNVKRSWDKSRAKKPESIVGKTLILSGFWRRQEMYGDLKVGDRIESGLQHQVNGSDMLSVAEFVRKVDKK